MVEDFKLIVFILNLFAFFQRVTPGVLLGRVHVTNLVMDGFLVGEKSASYPFFLADVFQATGVDKFGQLGLIVRHHVNTVPVDDAIRPAKDLSIGQGVLVIRISLVLRRNQPFHRSLLLDL